MDEIFNNGNYKKTNMQQLCPSYGGTGKTLTMGERLCDGCAGTGRDLKEDLWAGYCRKCNGKRKVPYCESRTCSRCRGVGKLF